MFNSCSVFCVVDGVSVYFFITVCLLVIVSLYCIGFVCLLVICCLLLCSIVVCCSLDLFVLFIGFNFILLYLAVGLVCLFTVVSGC